MNFGIVLISFIGILFIVGTVSIIMSILYENIPPAKLKLQPEPVIEKNIEAVFNNDNDFEFEFEMDEDLLE